jgi:hypothetical protein
VPQTQQPDIFWTAIDWAVKGAGALLLLVLSVGWKDYRRRMDQITELEKAVVRLETEISNLKEQRHG